MSGSAATRALVVDRDPSVVAEYRQILCTCDPSDADHDQLVQDLERDLYGIAVRHHQFPPVELTTCFQGEEALDAVHLAVHAGQPFSIVFIDLGLQPGLDGLQTAERIRAADSRVQIALVAGYSPLHPVDIVARVPPADRLSYVKKPFHPFEIQQAILASRQRWRIDEGHAARRAIGVDHGGQSTSRAILDRIPVGVLIFNRRDELVAANAAMLRQYANLADVFVPGTPYDEVCRQLCPDGVAAGDRFAGADQVWPLRGSRWALVIEGASADGERYCLFCDITERQHREAAYQRAAHSARLMQDFALLCDSVAGMLADNPPAVGRRNLALARLRAVAQQLHLVPNALDLASYLSHAVRRIRRQLPPGIGLEAIFDAELWPVQVDQEAFSRALAELTANACEAMPGTGRIILEAMNVRLSGNSNPVRAGLAAGDYVRLTVQDTGRGMPQPVAERALGPFQTGKDGKRHLGLGLPIVHAFALGLGGWLEVDGGEGSGAVVNVYLPKDGPRPNVGRGMVAQATMTRASSFAGSTGLGREPSRPAAQRHEGTGEFSG